MLEIEKRVLGEEHLNALTSMAGLAIIWKRLGRDQDAVELMRKVVDRRRDVLGSEHPKTVASTEFLHDWSRRMDTSYTLRRQAMAFILWIHFTFRALIWCLTGRFHNYD